MKKRFAKALIAAALVSTMAGRTAFATPAVDDLQADKAQAESEVQSLQTQLSETLNRIDTLEQDLADKQEEISRASEDLEEASYRQSQQYAAMKLRIKYMYEEGGSNLLLTLLSSNSFSDLLNKASYVQSVHNYDRKKLDEYARTVKEVEGIRESLQEEASSMQAMQTDLESEKEQLRHTIDTKQSEIALLDQNIQQAIAAREAAERAAAEEAERIRASQARANEQQSVENSNNQTTTVNPSLPGSDKPAEPTSPPAQQKPYVPPQGRDGWAVVAYARQFLGNPYVMGGTSLTNGADCSGFVQSIYKAFGIYLGRTTWDQEKNGVEIPFSEAQAGDLILYEGHVGIYNGTGGLIHASSPSVGIVEFSTCTYRPIKMVRRVL